MLAHLDVPFRDASADHLVWQLDAPLQPALAQRRIERTGWTLDLHLLGASHQVVLRTGDGVGCRELVACDPNVRGHLPADVVEERPGLRYSFRSAVEALGPDELAARAEALVAALGARQDALVGAFPGSPHAVTAIEATEDGWRTWHLYPQAGQVVHTETVVAR